MATFGFIGLGKMGGGLARNLIRSGYDVKVYDLSAAAVEKCVALGGRAAASAADAAQDVDALFTSLPMPADLLNLLLGDNGLYKVMKKGATLIDVSTIDPQTARQLADAAYAAGLKFLACPLGKGPAQAEEASEPIFAGGKKEVYEQWLPVLQKIGNPVYYVGDVEQSTAFKILSNLIGMTNLAVLGECLRIGEKAGIDPALLQELLKDTGANSFQLQVRGPWILNNDFAPRFAVDLALKDVRLGVNMAENWGASVDFCRLARDYYVKAQEQGLGQEDCAAVYKVF
ncbi:MAG: NAD(P)-dependent oxidoreductase [Desulfurispora sp.]|uniref:NAD(P)-dependent oxidoreductase n=1 Tax=Desulfurispora sp. TaxID=3014275 RepID=UPI00404B3A56